MKWTLIALAILFASPALATGNGDCDHPRFVEHGCESGGTPGADGADGQDGEDGRDGVDGQDGADGAQGEQGIQGIQGERGLQGDRGLPGVVSTEWINETRLWQTKWIDYSAATEAIQIHLPQEQTSRLTFGMSRIHGQSGYALGYAYKNEDGVAFTLGLGTSGGEQVGKASVGFEFGGGGGSSNHRHQLTCNYVGGVLTAEQEESQECN